MLSKSRHVIMPTFFQIYINILLILFLFYCYATSYTDALWIMPYLFTFSLISILISNNLSRMYLNSTYSLFIVCFSIFIGGRFFAFLINPSLDIYEMDFFVHYKMNAYQSLNLMCFLILGVCFLDVGYRLSYIRGVSLPNIEINHSWMRMLSVFTLLLSFVLVIELVSNIILAMSGGYLSSKLWQTKSYSFPLSSIAQTLFGICFGYSMVFGFKKKYYLFVFVFISLGSLLIGARGPIITAFLLCVWVLGKNGARKINILKLLFMGAIVTIIVSYFIQMYSFRSNGHQFDFDILRFISDFIYNQGVSAMVFDVSMKVSNYPLLSYFQTFFPGASAITSIFTPVEYYMTGFQHYMAMTLDPVLFNDGYGLDWTLFSDFYVFGGQNILGFCLLAFFFGAFIATIQNSSKHLIWLVLLFALFTRLMFLPRSSLSIVMPFIFYFSFFVIFIPKLSFLRK